MPRWLVLAWDGPRVGRWTIETGWVELAQDELRPLLRPCSMCERSLPESLGLAIAIEPSAVLCELCAWQLQSALAASAPGPAETPETWSGPRCSFCERPRGPRRPLCLGSNRNAVCGDCARAADHVLGHGLPDWRVDRAELDKRSGPWVDLRRFPASAAAPTAIPRTFAEQHGVIALCDEPHHFLVAAAIPLDAAVILELENRAGRQIEIVEAPRWRVEEMIKRAYDEPSS